MDSRTKEEKDVRTSMLDVAIQSEDGSVSSKEEQTERGNWGGKLDFILSCIGYSVGLGTIWRFPYLCYKNGGGAFLIPYVIFLVFFGIPLVFMEVSYGQFASLSPISVWRLSPLFKGVGYGMVLISGIVCVYYNIIITWTLYYLYKSFAAELPWASCGNPWNTPSCVDRRGLIKAREDALLFGNSSLLGNSSVFANSSVVESTTLIGNFTGNGSMNITSLLTNVSGKTASEEFWERHVLKMTSGIHDLGGIRWELFGFLALAWALVFLCLIKGIKSSGKVVYFTATFPYVVLVILLVRGVTLPGAMEGIKYYIIPDFNRLKDFSIWGEAAAQIFYSVGAAWGALITMASYNKFHNNIYRDALAIPLTDFFSSILGGFVIFSILGYMAHSLDKPISEVATQGPGLAFVVYPEACANLPIAPLWAILFFLMLLTLGLDSQFGMFETMISAFTDEFPELLRGRKILFTFILCVVEFTLGIPMVTEGGIYVLQVFDWYSSTFSLMIVSLIECLVISWVYGVERFYLDICMMIGKRPSSWWKICWCTITPALILFIFIFSIIGHKAVTYNEYIYPVWALAIGWILAVCSLVPLPIIAITEILKKKGSFLERLRQATQPTPEWGPAQAHYQKRYEEALRRNEIPRGFKALVSHNEFIIEKSSEEKKLALRNGSIAKSDSFDGLARTSV